MLWTFDRIVWKFGSVWADFASRPGTPTKNRLALSLPVVRVEVGAVLIKAWTSAVVGLVASNLKVHGPLVNGTVGEFGSSTEKSPRWARTSSLAGPLPYSKIVVPDGSTILYGTTKVEASTTILPPPTGGWFAEFPGVTHLRTKRERHSAVSRCAMPAFSAQPAGVFDRA